MRTIQVVASSFLLVVLGLATASAGCGGSDDPCIRACEDASDCNGKDTDCEADCADIASISGCKEVFDDLFACYEDNDVCSISILEDCGEEISATITCQVEFCNDNPDDPACDTEE